MPWLVIGCGNTHQTHVQHNDITMDIDAAKQPTVVGSIIDPQSAILNNAQYRRHFDVIYFENVPADIFNTPENCRVVVTHLTILLRANGQVRIRSGAAAKQHLPEIRKAFRSFGFVIEHDLIEFQTGAVTTSSTLTGAGLALSTATQRAQETDFMAKRGAGTAALSQESPI